MSSAPLSIAELFRKFGQSKPAPKVGQFVLIERGGKTDEAAFSLGEIVSAHIGGIEHESRLVVKEKYVYFADGRVSVPHRSPVTLPVHHFAKSIQERLLERAARLTAVAHEYQEWGDLPVPGGAPEA